MNRLPRARILALLLITMLPIPACGDDDAEPTCEAMPPGLGVDRVLVTDSCGDAWVRLEPQVKIDGEWQQMLGCSVESEQLVCDTAVGSVTVSVPDLQITFTASGDARRVEALALVGDARIPGATGWLSNGFQSWSQSGIIAIAESVDASDLHDALRERGDGETLRTGREVSWFYSWVGGDRATLFAGALGAHRWRPWVRVERAGTEELRIWLVSGDTGESVVVPAGTSVSSETWRVAVGTQLEETLQGYGLDLPSRRDAVSVPADAGWNSWYDLWDDVDEAAVRANADLVAGILRDQVPPDRPLRVVVDDGWQVRWGEWTPNAKFPSGLDGLATDLHAQGFEVGVWLAPLLVTEDSSLVLENPEWFVTDTFYNHALMGRMAVLDPTHPGAAAHLQRVITRIVEWGFDFLKIDFLFAGSWEGPRHEDVTGMEAYHRALSLIREAAGEDTILLAVGAPPLPSFPHVDAWRVGPDIAFEPLGPSWYFAINQARTIAARWPLCLATLCDPDPPVLRELPWDEVEYGGWVVALAGGGLFLSDDLRDLSEERRTWGLDGARVTASLSGVPAVPEDVFPAEPPLSLTSHANDHLAGKNRHVLPSRWRLPDGSRVVFNHGEDPITVRGVPIPPHGASAVP